MERGPGRFLRLLLLVAGAVLCVLSPAAPAAAHNSLTSSDPKDGARLAQPPANVRLTFLAKVDPNTTKITLTGPGEASALDGEPTFAGSRVTVPVRSGPAGLYTLAYEVSSSDGHPIKGRIRFTVTDGVSPSPSASASPTSAVAASPSVPGTTAAAAPSVDPASAGQDGQESPWPWIVGGVVVLATAALLGGLLLRGRRTSDGQG